MGNCCLFSNEGGYMKKVLCCTAAAAMLLCGCSSKHTPQSVSSVEEEVQKDYGVWLMKPQRDYTAVSELSPQGQGLVKINTEKSGELYIAYEMEMDEYPSAMAGYRHDASIVENNNKQGMVSMTGSELIPIELDMMNSSRMAGISYGWKKEGTGYTGVFAITSQIKGKAYVLSKDCSSTEEISLDDYSTTPPTLDYAAPYLALQNGVFGAVVMSTSETGASSGWYFDPLDPSILKTRVVIDTVDDACNTLHKVIYDPSTGAVSELSDIGKYVEGSFINGYYCVTDSNGLVSVIETASSQPIAYQYQRASIPQEGYIALRKYGKWGYASLDGQEVTDFIFDDARPVTDGNAYVLYNGAWGILRMDKALSDSEQINIATVSEPCSDESKGEVSVIIDGLTIRDGHSSDAQFLGNACHGSVYPYYETAEEGGYTWYRITSNAWIADLDGQWVKVHGQS